MSDGNAVDLNDASARYSRIHHVPETAYVEVGTDADESLHPVLRGVSMVPCDPDSCPNSSWSVFCGQLPFQFHVAAATEYCHPGASLCLCWHATYVLKSAMSFKRQWPLRGQPSATPSTGRGRDRLPHRRAAELDVNAKETALY